MKYHEDTGTVVEVDDGKAHVRLDHEREEDCGSCCACSSFGAGKPEVWIEGEHLETGDRVRVRIPEVNSYLSMFLLFGLPFAFFVGGMALGQHLGTEGEAGNLSAMMGLAGLALAVGIAMLVNWFLGRKVRPEVSRLPAEADNPDRQT